MKKILILSGVAMQCFLSGCSIGNFSVNENNNINEFEFYSNIGVEEISKSNFEESSIISKYVLDNLEYSFPTSVKELKRNGWVLEDTSIKRLKSGDKISSIILKNGYKEIVISIENNSNRSKAIDDCYINGILVQDLQENNVQISVFNDISIGSEKEEVEKILVNYNVETRECDETINYIFNKNGYITGISVNKLTGNVFNIFLLELN